MKKRNEEKETKKARKSPSSSRRKTSPPTRKKTDRSRPSDNEEDPTFNEFPERNMPEGVDADYESGSYENRSELNDEDREALGPVEESMDMGEDERELKHRPWPPDFSGEDLDVPGSELDDKEEETGMEDEENNPYSLGGDRHENLEEDNT